MKNSFVKSHTRAGVTEDTKKDLQVIAAGVASGAIGALANETLSYLGKKITKKSATHKK